MLYSLIYTSRVAAPMLPKALLVLLALARTNNGAQHLTGVLLYSEGHFLQVLEGAREEVEALFAKIRRDPRHSRVQVVGQGAIRRREFPTWGMGFSQLSYPVFTQLRRLVRHPKPEAGLPAARPRALPLRDLVQPFVLQVVTQE